MKVKKGLTFFSNVDWRHQKTNVLKKRLGQKRIQLVQFFFKLVDIDLAVDLGLHSEGCCVVLY